MFDSALSGTSLQLKEFFRWLLSPLLPVKGRAIPRKTSHKIKNTVVEMNRNRISAEISTRWWHGDAVSRVPSTQLLSVQRFTYLSLSISFCCLQPPTKNIPCFPRCVNVCVKTCDVPSRLHSRVTHGIPGISYGSIQIWARIKHLLKMKDQIKKSNE